MTDIIKAGMTQSTFSDGTLGEWSVVIKDNELFKMSKDYSVEQMFEIRDIIKLMMDKAYSEGMEEATRISKIKLDKIVDNGESVLNAFKEENERLASALERVYLEGNEAN